MEAINAQSQTDAPMSEQTVADDFLLASGNYALALLELTIHARTPRSSDLLGAISDFQTARSHLIGWAEALDATSTALLKDSDA